MAWYLLAIPIVLIIIIKLVIPYIQKNHLDDTKTCGICRKKSFKKLKGCPNCGVGYT